MLLSKLYSSFQALSCFYLLMPRHQHEAVLVDKLKPDKAVGDKGMVLLKTLSRLELSLRKVERKLKLTSLAEIYSYFACSIVKIFSRLVT